MIHQIYNDLSDIYFVFGHKVTQTLSTIESKIKEIAKRIFDSIGRFIIGFCIGAAVTFVSLNAQVPLPLLHLVNYRALAATAFAVGVILGLGNCFATKPGELSYK